MDDDEDDESKRDALSPDDDESMRSSDNEAKPAEDIDESNEWDYDNENTDESLLATLDTDMEKMNGETANRAPNRAARAACARAGSGLLVVAPGYSTARHRVLLSRTPSSQLLNSARQSCYSNPHCPAVSEFRAKPCNISQRKTRARPPTRTRMNLPWTRQAM